MEGGYVGEALGSRYNASAHPPTLRPPVSFIPFATTLRSPLRYGNE